MVISLAGGCVHALGVIMVAVWCGGRCWWQVAVVVAAVVRACMFVWEKPVAAEEVRGEARAERASPHVPSSCRGRRMCICVYLRGGCVSVCAWVGHGVCVCVCVCMGSVCGCVWVHHCMDVGGCVRGGGTEVVAGRAEVRGQSRGRSEPTGGGGRGAQSLSNNVGGTGSWRTWLTRIRMGADVLEL